MHTLITLYCPKILPDFVESVSCTVPTLTRTVLKFTLFCWKNHLVLSPNFPCTVPISTCTVPILTFTVQKLTLICRKICLDLDLISNSHIRNNDLVLPLNFDLVCPKNHLQSREKTSWYVSVTCSAIAWLGHNKRIIHLFSTRLLNYGGLDP